jgi:hypothetical protein
MRHEVEELKTRFKTKEKAEHEENRQSLDLTEMESAVLKLSILCTTQKLWRLSCYFASRIKNCYNFHNPNATQVIQIGFFNRFMGQ